MSRRVNIATAARSIRAVSVVLAAWNPYAKNACTCSVRKSARCDEGGDGGGGGEAGGEGGRGVGDGGQKSVLIARRGLIGEFTVTQTSPG